MPQQEPSAAQKMFGDVAPKLADMTDDILFGPDGIWQRPQLAPRDRSLITLTVLTATYRIEQLEFHINKALDNGLSKDEIIELMTHVTLYAGWPTGVSAVMRAKKVFEERGI